MCMVTKTITITEDAYRALAIEKLPDESFSELIRRKFGKSDIWKFAGAWKNMPEEDFSKLKRSMERGRSEMHERFSGKK